MRRAENLRSDTNHVGKGEAGKDGAPETSPVSAVRPETREGQRDVDLSALRKTMCHLKNTALLPLHPTATTWGPGRHDLIFFFFFFTSFFWITQHDPLCSGHPDKHIQARGWTEFLSQTLKN